MKDNDYVVNGQIISDDISDLFIVTQRGACKRMKIDAFEKTSRARRGVHMLRELKTKPHRIIGFYTISQDEKIRLVTNKEKRIEVVPYGLPISDRNSNGSFIIDADEEGTVLYTSKEAEYDIPFKD